MKLDPHQTEFVSLLKGLSGRFRPHELFSDFCELSALSLHAHVETERFYAVNYERYTRLVTKYSDQEKAVFDKMFDCLVNSLEGSFKDSLGELFMVLELGNHWKGQFFTPYELCKLMAKVVMGDPQQRTNRHGFFQMYEPCSGAGAMVIAYADALHESDFAYQDSMHVIAQDLDATAVHMSYIQLSLYAIPAVVIHCNSLNPTQNYGYWKTFKHVHGDWDLRLSRASAVDTMLNFMREGKSSPDEQKTEIILPPLPVAISTPPAMNDLRQRRNDTVQKYRESMQMGLF
ncbi:MAG: N-6 DNA methylase [Candidatus Saccharibacteria bacterium]|nr:N-6 DNA methylase [Candidatus Saccharibacteria bacterium]